MTTNEVEESTREREHAVARLEKQRDFQGHLVAYLVVKHRGLGGLGLTGAGYPWPAWLDRPAGDRTSR